MKDNLPVVVQENVAHDDLHVLVTSNELILDAEWPPLTINEQRLVIYMLSWIKKSDTDFRPLEFSVRDLDKMFGTRNDLYDVFREATYGLLQKVICWREPENKNKELRATWCSHATIEKGTGLVSLAFDPVLKPFFIALKGNFTAWGDRRAVLGLKNHYSLRIYQLLKYNQGLAVLDNRKFTCVELEWLKGYLCVPPGSYPLYGSLKSKILEPVKKDIDAKTDLIFDFEGKKTGRKVTKIKLSWKKNKKYRQMELPGITEGGKASVKDILIYEFAISPESLAEKWVTEYGRDHIQNAIFAAHEYIDEITTKGQKLKGSKGGVVRKAIEQGWKPKKKSVIDIALEEEKKKAIQVIEEAKQQKKKEEGEREKKEEEMGNKALEKFNNYTESQKKVILAGFREYLVGLGNQVVVTDYDSNGINDSVILNSLLKVFLKEYYFEAK